MFKLGKKALKESGIPINANFFNEKDVVGYEEGPLVSWWVLGARLSWRSPLPWEDPISQECHHVGGWVSLNLIYT